MNRWNIVREKRKDIEYMDRMEERKELFKFWWIRKKHTVDALRVVFDLFDKKRTSIFQGYKEKLFAKRITRMLNKSIVRKGPEISDRICNTMRMVNNSSMIFMKDICDNRSKNILYNFMTVSSMNYFTKDKFTGYYNKVSAIQHRWLQIRGSNDRRVELLLKLWDREHDIMTMY